MQTRGEEREGKDNVIFGEHPLVVLTGALAFLPPPLSTAARGRGKSTLTIEIASEKKYHIRINVALIKSRWVTL